MTTTIVPTLLNRKNYDDWSSRIKSYLLAEDLWDVVERKYDNNNNEALRKKDAKALYAIENSCGKDAYKLIKDADTANGAWDTLQETLRPAYNRSSDEQGMKTIVEAYMSLTLTPLVVMEEGRTGGIYIYIHHDPNILRFLTTTRWYSGWKRISGSHFTRYVLGSILDTGESHDDDQGEMPL